MTTKKPKNYVHRAVGANPRRLPKHRPRRTQEQIEAHEQRMAKMAENRYKTMPEPITWKDAESQLWTPSERRLDTYTPDQRRVLEVRLYQSRKCHLKPDEQISQELDLAMDEFDVLSPHSRRGLA